MSNAYYKPQYSPRWFCVFVAIPFLLLHFLVWTWSYGPALVGRLHCRPA